MPGPVPSQNTKLELSRPVRLDRLRTEPEFAFDVTPDPAETEALVRLYGIRGLRKVRFTGMLRAVDGGVMLEGHVGATAIQSCVVTLEPVTTRIEQDVRRRYLRNGSGAARQIVIDAEAAEEDEIEPLGDEIDLGLVATEAIALALPAYPRRPGAVLPEIASGDMPNGEGRTHRPFVGLAALRGKLDSTE